METTEFNEEFKLAAEFVLHTNKNIFLTGKAGTGKTTFLKYIQSHSQKNTIVLAPTGVAAINAGGMTMHSFFQLPFQPFIPEVNTRGFRDENNSVDANSFFQRTHFGQTKIDLYRELELLIIDEVSMLRCDYLDCVDMILRRYRKQHNQPFGGVQVLFIGDMFQLPPVVKEWDEIKNYYETPFFFSAKVLQENMPINIELKKIYRQNEERFISLLNKIRNNKMEDEDYKMLNNRFQPEALEGLENHITLTTHNWKADKINQTQLQRLDAELHTFEGEITGDFEAREFPMEYDLHLKVGAQVMFIKNDSDIEKKYYNGKLATIKRISDDKITVRFKDNNQDFELRTETWKKVKYKLNGESNKIEEDVIGTFKHFPIKLAWVITIHKSQGLTFEKAVIDAGQSFAPGQVYVALSRCTNLDGLFLSSNIAASAVTTDERIIAFDQLQNKTEELKPLLEAEKKVYQKTVLVKTFDWNRMNKSVDELKMLVENKQIPEKEKAQTMINLIADCNKNLSDTSDKFMPQLQKAFLADDFEKLNDLLQRAIPYYCNELHTKFIKPLNAHIADLYGKPKVKQYLKEAVEIESLWWNKIEQLQKLQYNETIFYKGDSFERKQTSNELKEKIQRKTQRGDTHRESFEMYKKGMSLDAIAAQRNLSKTTIESHLAVFVADGKIDIYELIPKEKLQKIDTEFKKMTEERITPLKEKLGDDFSFGEIRMALAHLKNATKYVVD